MLAKRTKCFIGGCVEKPLLMKHFLFTSSSLFVFSFCMLLMSGPTVAQSLTSTTTISTSINNELALVETTTATNTYVDFTLRNNSLKSIPLIIPGVMRPNLSPRSNSGVGLVVGQKILFKYKGKKRVLLIVSEDLEGSTLEVSKLLKQRKKEIDRGEA